MVEARSLKEFEKAFAAMTRERAAALHAAPSALFFKHRNRLAELAAKHRLPAMHRFEAHAEAGDLMAYAADLAEAVRRAATFVDKILKGAKPADLPVEQPMRFHLVINLKTAKALGLTIPQSVLIRPGQLIQ